LFSRNSVYAALLLIINFCTIAVFYLLLNAPFLAIAQVTIYAGAIMVLFLFVIMLLGAERIPPAGVIRWERPFAFILGLILLVEAGYVIYVQQPRMAVAETVTAAFGDPKSIGQLLFSEYLLPFEATSILLLSAVVGAILLTKKDKR